MIAAQPWPEGLRYFTALEFGPWAQWMDHEFLFRLDELRDRLGFVLKISPAAGALGRTGEQYKSSQHYFDPTNPRYLRVADIMPVIKGHRGADAEEIAFVVRMAKQLGFTGIGIYPTWKPYPGVHLDMRHGEHVATWGDLGGGAHNYVALDRALEAWPKVSV